MKRPLFALLALLIPATTMAITNGRPARDRDGLRRQVVRIENSLGELCSGVLVAPDVVLTAAHCLSLPARYHVVVLDNHFKPISIPIVAIESHRDFVPSQQPHRQTGTDLALVRLQNAVPADMHPAPISASAVPQPGTALYPAGYGSTSYNNTKSARILRIATLTVLAANQPPNNVTLAADPSFRGRSPGAGACRGVSGGPVFMATDEGYIVGGIITWSSRAEFARDSSPCGGVTALTPIAPHSGWITRAIGRLHRAG